MKLIKLISLSKTLWFRRRNTQILKLNDIFTIVVLFHKKNTIHACQKLTKNMIFISFSKWKSPPDSTEILDVTTKMWTAAHLTTAADYTSMKIFTSSSELTSSVHTQNKTSVAGTMTCTSKTQSDPNQMGRGRVCAVKEQVCLTPKALHFSTVKCSLISRSQTVEKTRSVKKLYRWNWDTYYPNIPFILIKWAHAVTWTLKLKVFNFI